METATRLTYDPAVALALADPEPAAPAGNRSAGADEPLLLSIVMPCLNEARTLPGCIRKARAFLDRHDVAGEVVVADNGSTDGSRRIAREMGAVVVSVETRGYGAALAAGIEASRGRYVIMGDSDGSYDFAALAPFVDKLQEGNDLVMGNRFAGGIAAGAMPAMHQYFGNPLLTRLGRLFFRSDCGDFYCGLRGFSREAWDKLELKSQGMEFALEMLVKATVHGLRVAEVPTTLEPDGRDRPPHLRRWRDGWRSLRFYLLFSPRWLFWYPGLLLMTIGAALFLWLLAGTRTLGTVNLDVHTLAYAGSAVVLGYQAVIFAVFAKYLAVIHGLHPPQRGWVQRVARFPFEVGLVAGLALMVLGVGGGLYMVSVWLGRDFGNLDPFVAMRIVIPSVTAMILGCQTFFGGFYLGFLQLVDRGVRGR